MEGTGGCVVGEEDKVRQKQKACVLISTLHRARTFVDDTQPPHVRQHIDPAAWFGFSKIDEGSAYFSMGPRSASRTARTFRKARVFRILRTLSEITRQRLREIASQLPLGR